MILQEELHSLKAPEWSSSHSDPLADIVVANTSSTGPSINHVGPVVQRLMQAAQSGATDTPASEGIRFIASNNVLDEAHDVYEDALAHVDNIRAKAVVEEIHTAIRTAEMLHETMPARDDLEAYSYFNVQYSLPLDRLLAIPWRYFHMQHLPTARGIRLVNAVLSRIIQDVSTGRPDLMVRGFSRLFTTLKSD